MTYFEIYKSYTLQTRGVQCTDGNIGLVLKRQLQKLRNTITVVLLP